MKFILTFILVLFLCLAQHAQENAKPILIDTALAKKITVSGFCLCRTSITELHKLSDDFKKVEVEEMDTPKKCIAHDSRFENGEGYYSQKYAGLIFQKDPDNDYVSKIRLTKDFKGNLPDGTFIDLKNLQLRDVFKNYPNLKGKWGSRGCSNYWSFSNDTLLFYVKIDSAKKPQFPIDEMYYYDKPIEAIDLVLSCYSIIEKANNRYDQLFNDPVIFVDSVNVTRIELQKYQPNEIASVTVYKNRNAIKVVGPQGKYGAVYIETKKFARNKYWNFLTSKSADYLKIVPTPQSDSTVIYILNGKVLSDNFEGDLSLIDNKNFIALNIIDKDKLQKDYKVSDKVFGVVITTNAKKKNN